MKTEKTNHYSGIVLIISACIFLLITANKCEMDECDETMEPQYLVTVIPTAQVKDKDGKPLAYVTVNFSMQKTHCDGKLSQEFTYSGVVYDEEGGVIVCQAPVQFKMNNLKDNITVKAGIAGEEIKTMNFNYNDLKSYSGTDYVALFLLVKQ